jgi:hypothetical protein
MRAAREGDLVRQCLDYLQLRKVPCWRQNSGSAMFGAGGKRRFVRFAVTGCADILGVLPPGGRILAVECKRPGGRLTPAQAAFLRCVAEAGGLAVVVRDLRDLQRALEAEALV